MTYDLKRYMERRRAEGAQGRVPSDHALITFFAIELPWAFGSRMPGMGRHLPAPWYDKMDVTIPRVKAKKRKPRRASAARKARRAR